MFSDAPEKQVQSALGPERNTTKVVQNRAFLASFYYTLKRGWETEFKERD